MIATMPAAPARPLTRGQKSMLRAFAWQMAKGSYQANLARLQRDAAAAFARGESFDSFLAGINAK